MKWIALALFLLAIPLLAAWLKTSPRNARWAWGLLGFLPFALGPWHLMVAPYAIPGWSGYVKGWEISLLDTVAIAVILGTRTRLPKLTLLLLFAAYLFAAAISVIHARFGMFAAAYLIQLLRVIIVYIAVAKVVQEPEGERAVLSGLVLGLALQAGYALWARAGGVLQTGGSLGHQNLLGFVSHLALMPAFAMLLAGRWTRMGSLGLIAGVIVVILTVSRATIGFSSLGLLLTLILSMLVRLNPRKGVAAFGAIVVLAIAAPFAHTSLERRMAAQGTTFFAEDLERDAFTRAAESMIKAKPMGVGPNHYVFIANTEGYSERAGVAWASGSRSTSVHNSYLLIAAETGYLGLLTFVVLLSSAIWMGLRTAFRYCREPGADVLIGVSCGLVIVGIHAMFEWMFVTYPSQYLFAISLGLVSGLQSRFKRTKRASRAKVPWNGVDEPGFVTPYRPA